MRVVAVICHPVGQVVDAVAQSHYAALQGGDGLCRTGVTGDDAELFTDCPKLERMHQHGLRFFNPVLLGQHDGRAVLVVYLLGAQVVVGQFGGHGGVFQCGGDVLAIQQAGEKVYGLCCQSAVAAMPMNGRWFPP